MDVGLHLIPGHLTENELADRQEKQAVIDMSMRETEEKPGMQDTRARGDESNEEQGDSEVHNR